MCEDGGATGVARQALAGQLKLPDDFVEAGGGSAAHRLVELVGENWVEYEIKARAELVEALLPILEPLLKSRAVVLCSSSVDR